MELAYAGMALLVFIAKMVVAGFALVIGGSLAVRFINSRVK